MSAVSVKWSICFLVCGHKNGFLTLAVENVFNIPRQKSKQTLSSCQQGQYIYCSFILGEDFLNKNVTQITYG